MDAALDPELINDPSEIRAILTNLSGEIGRPLDRLQQGIGTILAAPGDSMTDVERSQAATMLVLCEEIDRLTRQCLGKAGSV